MRTGRCTGTAKGAARVQGTRAAHLAAVADAAGCKHGDGRPAGLRAGLRDRIRHLRHKAQRCGVAAAVPVAARLAALPPPSNTLAPTQPRNAEKA